MFEFFMKEDLNQFVNWKHCRKPYVQRSVGVLLFCIYRMIYGIFVQIETFLQFLYN